MNRPPTPDTITKLQNARGHSSVLHLQAEGGIRAAANLSVVVTWVLNFKSDSDALPESAASLVRQHKEPRNQNAQSPDMSEFDSNGRVLTLGKPTRACFIIWQKLWCAEVVGGKVYVSKARAQPQ